VSRLILTILTVAGPALAAPGRLTVVTEPAGLPVYLDNEPLGRAPVVNLELAPGEYWVTMFNPDSLEDRYSVIRHGTPGAKLAALWYLARVNAGTSRIELGSGANRQVILSLPRANRAARRAKWLAGAAVGGPLVIGTALGLTIGLLAGR
jgi:hypothetical protein